MDPKLKAGIDALLNCGFTITQIATGLAEAIDMGASATPAESRTPEVRASNRIVASLVRVGRVASIAMTLPDGPVDEAPVYARADMAIEAAGVCLTDLDDWRLVAVMAADQAGATIEEQKRIARVLGVVWP